MIDARQIIAERKQWEYAEQITKNFSRDLLYTFCTDRKTYPQLYKVAQELLSALHIQEDDAQFLSSVMSKVQTLMDIPAEERKKYRTGRNQYMSRINTQNRRNTMSKKEKKKYYTLFKQLRERQNMAIRDNKIVNKYIRTLLKQEEYRYTTSKRKVINYSLLATTLNTILTKEQSSIPRTTASIAQYIRHYKLHRGFKDKVPHIPRTHEEEIYLESLLKNPTYTHTKYTKGKPNFHQITEELNKVFHQQGPTRTYNSVIGHIKDKKR